MHHAEAVQTLADNITASRFKGITSDNPTMLYLWSDSEPHIIRFLSGHLTDLVGCLDDGQPKTYEVITIPCMFNKL